jgi:hypothetical protein
MTAQGTFSIEGSFKLTGHGLVIYGDIVDGIVSKQNFISFINEGQEMKLKISDVNFIDRISENVAKVGLTFYYDSNEQREKLENVQVAIQEAKITSD